MKQKFKQAGLVVLVLFLFITAKTTVNAQDAKQEFTYVKIEVKGLACPFCAYGLEKKLKDVDGVKNIKIDVEEGLAFLSANKSQRPTIEILKKIVIDAGFTPSNIEYSEIPFVLKEDE
jgi:copper chaperone CopZ